MRKRFRAVPAALILLVIWATPSTAEDKIQAFRASDGKIVFTNGDNTPAAPIADATSSAQPLPSSDPIHALIETIASYHGVDPALVKAIVKTESNFNRWAVSSKGARGLMQLIPGTGARFGVLDFFDPRQNIEGGVRYMKFLLEKFKGDLDLSLAAYNAGENLVERLGRIPSIPETRDYVRKVRASYGKSASVANPAQVVEIAKQETPQIYRSVDGHGVVHFSNIAPPR